MAGDFPSTDQRTAEPVLRAPQSPPSLLRDGVRRASIEDAEAIAWIRTLAWQVAAEQALVTDAPQLGLFATAVRTWNARLRNHDVRVLVCVRDGDVVGYAALKSVPDDDVAEVLSAHLHPAHWHTRAVDSLLYAACDHCRQRGFRAIRIDVASDTVPTQYALLRAGFVLTAKTLRRCHVHHRYELALNETYVG